MSITTTWERVFAADTDACRAEGFVEDDRTALVDAVKGGSPVRVAAFRAPGPPVFDCPIVWVRSHQVYAQTDRVPVPKWANTTSCDHDERGLRYPPSPRINQSNFSTNGERTTFGWNPKTHAWGQAECGRGGHRVVRRGRRGGDVAPGDAGLGVRLRAQRRRPPEGHRRGAEGSEAQRWSILVDTNGRYETFIWHETDGRTRQHGARTRAASWYVRR